MSVVSCTPLAAFALNAKLVLKPERREDFIKVIKYDQQQTLEIEPGALQFVIGEDETTPNVFYLHEEYKSHEDFQYHESTDHFAKWVSFVKEDPFAEAPVVEFYTLCGPATTKEQIPVRKSYCLNIKLQLNPKRREEFLKAISANQGSSLKNEWKCLSFQFGESTDTPNVFHLYEEYVDKEGFNEHKGTAHYEAYKKFSWSDNAFLVPPTGHKYSSI